MHNSPSAWAIFRVFFRLGLTAFGGPAMLPVIRRRLVDSLGWIPETEFTLSLGLCQALPGATLMQLAAAIGRDLAGFPGAVAGFCGFALPAFLMMTGFSMAYAHTRQLPALVAALDGLKVMVVAICAMGSLQFLLRYARTPMRAGLAAGAAMLFLIGLKPFSIIMGGAIIGVLTFGDRKPQEQGALPLDPAGGAGHPQAPPIVGHVDAKLYGGSGGALPPRPPEAALPPPYPWRLPVGLLMLFLAMVAGLFFLDPLLGRLAVSMAKVDVYAFGGYGAFPVMFAEVVRYRGWLDEQTFMDAMAMAQVTPGPYLLASAFVGFQLKGVLGAVVGAMSVFVPSFICIMAAAPARNAILRSDWAHKAVAGVLATLGGMILAVSIRFAQAVPWDWPQAALLAAAVAALALKIDILWVVLAGAGAGALLF